jgi:3-oxoacyl-[acyl-carrier-protein] synthase-1
MQTISVLASGMVTAVGFNGPASCAAMRAGISGIAQTTLVDPESGNNISGGRVSLPHWWIGTGKLAELAAPAIDECLTAAAPEPTASIPILLAVAEPTHPCRPANLETELLDEIEFRLGTGRHRHSAVFPQGHVGGVYALLRARDLINAGRARACIVAGVHSYFDQQVIDTYVEKRRILTDSNSNGFFPGEAGTAILVAASGSQSTPELQILGIGTATEAATIESHAPLRAEGLTAAINEALTEAGMTMSQAAYRITDLTGEHYKFKEAAFAAGRLDSAARTQTFHLWHPIEFIGEVGAAIVPCVLGVAFHAGIRGYAPGSTALCHFGGDGHDRAALVVTHVDGV